MKKILLVFLLLPFYAIAQKDTSFWFSAPDVLEFLGGNPHDKPILLRLISFTLVNTSIAANSTTTIDLSSWENLAGDYVYYIKSVNLCGETIKKGNVLLIR